MQAMVGVLIALVAALVIMGGVALNEYMSNEDQPSEVRPHVQYVYDPPVNSEGPSAPTTDVADSSPASPVSTDDLTTYTTADGTIITGQRPPSAPVSADGQSVSTAAASAAVAPSAAEESAREVSEATDRPGNEAATPEGSDNAEVASGEAASPMPDPNL